MVIGLDFDNTIICYDSLFRRIAVEQGLMPVNLAATKEQVRNYLRCCGKEQAWTELQGYVYGERILEADAFPGLLDFINRCQRQKARIIIISHKTRFPFEGPQYDLHAAAWNWLKQAGICEAIGSDLIERQVFFEPTKLKKLTRIADTGCQYFVDDLPEFLVEPEFPKGVNRILFDPARRHIGLPGIQSVGSWKEIERIIFQPEL